MLLQVGSLLDKWHTFKYKALCKHILGLQTIPISASLLLPQRDLAALEKKVETLSQEASRLAGSYPDSASHVMWKEREVGRAWQRLLARSQARKNKLVQAEQLQRYLNDFRDLR